MITTERIREITTDRLREWGEIAIAKHTTPAVLLCIGHDQVSGELHLMCPENLDLEGLRKLLQRALDRLAT